jgi:hypothetical protein
MSNDELNLTEEVVTLPITTIDSFVEENDEDEGQSLSLTSDYSTIKIDQKNTFVSETGEVIDEANVTVLDKMKISARAIGQELGDPDKNCKHCYGRGYTGINIDGNIPQPCKCLYKKFFKENPNWRNQQMPSWNRKAKRQYDKAMTKYINLQASAMKSKFKIEEKSRANLGKNTPGFIKHEDRIPEVTEYVPETSEAIEAEIVEAEVV